MPDLFALVEDDKLADVEACLEKSPISVNDYNKNGVTPLSIAVQNKNVNMAKRLLQHGADPNARATAAAGTYQGYTPVHFAAKTDELPLLDLLHEKGGSLKLAGKDGWTPLHVACFSNCLQSIKWLVARKVDVNALDEHMVPPIVSIVSHGRMDAMRVLVKAGAKLSIKDVTGDTLFHHAMHTTMHRLFENSYTLPEVQIDAACVLAVYGLDAQVPNRDGLPATAYVAKEFGSDTFCKVLQLLYMNGELLRKAEGTVTDHWNYMTLLSVKTRQVFEQLGIHGQQAKDLVDLLQAFDKERTDRKDASKKKPSNQSRLRKTPLPAKTPEGPSGVVELGSSDSDDAGSDNRRDGAKGGTKQPGKKTSDGGADADGYITVPAVGDNAAAAEAVGKENRGLAAGKTTKTFARVSQQSSAPNLPAAATAAGKTTKTFPHLSALAKQQPQPVEKAPKAGQEQQRQQLQQQPSAPEPTEQAPKAGQEQQLLLKLQQQLQQQQQQLQLQQQQQPERVVESRRVVEKIVDVRWQHPDALPPPRVDLAWAYGNRTAILCCVICFLLGHVCSQALGGARC